MSTELELKQLSGTLGRELQLKHLKLAVAESCTGGWLSEVITSVSGSSNWFDRGFVVYTNKAKQELLHVSEAMLEQFGAVSEQVVEAMAIGALNNSHADVGVAITGIAGPSGGTEEKPVGLIWFGFSVKDESVKTYHRHFNGDRESIRQQAVKFALKKLIELINPDIA